MKPKIARLALALAASVSLAQCNEIAYPAKFTVKVMDEEGNFIDAHYAKEHDDFIFGVINSKTGLLGFDCYFYPTQNDRNLELELEKNLFPNVSVRLP